MSKTWKQKLEGGASPRVEITKRAFAGIGLGAKMLISSASEVRAFIASVPWGSSVTVPELRATLAQRHNAEVTCPLTTGIFLRIVSEAALEDIEQGAALETITPFWRVVGPKDALAKKLRCGPEFVAERRREEGIAE